MVKHRRLSYLFAIVLAAGFLVSSFIPALALASQGRVAAPDFAWSATGSLSVGRALGAAARLSGGRVLAAGGYTTSGTTATTEIYDPATGVWTPTGSMTNPRTNHSLTLLQNGTVLAAGGTQSDVFLNSAEIYDPETQAWTATGSMSSARANHTATLLQDGTVLVVGGRGSSGILASAEIYHPDTGTWTSAGSMNTVRSTHQADLLANGTVLVSGGCSQVTSSNCTSILSSAEIYDPVTGGWSGTSSMNQARSGHMSAALSNGEVLVVGGCTPGDPGANCPTALATAERYNPESGTWSPAASANSGRTVGEAVLLSTGKVLIAGGCAGYVSMGGCTILATSELYSPLENTWSAAGNMSVGRFRFSLAALDEGRALAAGGLGNGITASADLFTSVAQPTPPPPTPTPNPTPSPTPTPLPVSHHIHYIAILAFDNNLDPMLLDVIERFRKGSAANGDVEATLLVDGAADGDSRALAISRGFVTQLEAPEFTGELDTSSPDTISAFLSFARQRYPEDITIVSFLGHGVGPTPEIQHDQNGMRSPASSLPPLPSRRDFTPSDVTSGTYLSTPELGRALAAATENGAKPFDILFLDGCFEGNLDVLYQVRSAAKVFIASPSYAWAGFFYDLYLTYLKPFFSLDQMARYIVGIYQNGLGDGYPNVIFSVRQENIENIAMAVSYLGDVLKQADASEPWARDAILDASLASQYVDTTLCAGDFEQCPPDELVSAASFARNLRERFPAEGAVYQAAGSVLEKLSAIYSIGVTGHPWLKPEVTWSYSDTLTILAPLTPTLQTPLAWRYTIYTSTAPLQATWAPVPTQTVTILTPLAYTVDYHWDEFLASWYGPVTPTVGAWCNVFPLLAEQAVQPTVPITLTAQAGYDSIRLNWNATNSPEVVEYRIQRAAGESQNFETIATVAELKFFDTGLTPGARYCYRVQALLSGGVVATVSNVACATFGEVVLSVPDTLGTPGEDAIVPVLIQNAHGLSLAAADIWMDYDARLLEPVNISSTALTTGYAWSFTTVVDGDKGRVKISTASGSAPMLYGDGALFWITFHVANNPVSTSPLDLKEYITGVGGTRIYVPGVPAGQPPLPVSLVLTDGVFRADCHFRMGDVTGDCTVDSGDAYLALWFIANPQTPPSGDQLHAADVNGNGMIDTGDVAMILYYATHNQWPMPGSSLMKGVSESDPVVFSLDQAKAVPGGKAQLGLHVQNPSGLSGLELIVAYNPAVVTGLSVEPAAGAAGFNLQTHDDGAGMLRIALASSGAMTGDGQLATIQLTLAEGSGASSSTTLSISSIQVYDVYGREFTTSALQQTVQQVSGRVTITSLKSIFMPMVAR